MKHTYEIEDSVSNQSIPTGGQPAQDFLAEQFRQMWIIEDGYCFLDGENTVENCFYGLYFPFVLVKE